MGTKDRWKLYIFGIILLVVNTIGVVYVYPSLHISINGVRTAGKIKATYLGRKDAIKHISGRASMPSRGYNYEIYEIHYMAYDKEVYKFYDDGGLLKNKWKKGDIVPVVYDKIKPQEAKIGSFNRMWSNSLIALFMLVFINTGVIAEIRVVWKKYRKL